MTSPSTSLPLQTPPPLPRSPRYDVSDSEHAILVPAIRRYFESGFRSAERNSICREVVQFLAPFGPHWTTQTVRHWFTNNRAKYLGPPKEPEQLPILPLVHPELALLKRRVDILEQQLREMAGRSAPAESRERSRDELTERLALFVGQSTVPLSIVDSPAFRSLISDLSSGSVLPCRATVRSRLIQLARDCRSSLTPQTEQSRFVSLMVDGVRAAGQNWLRVCLSTARGFYFWRIIAIENQQAVTIASILTEVISNLRDSGFTVCAVVTDNASNEIKGIQRLTSGMLIMGEPIMLFRIPCLSHTANLVLHDFIQGCFPRVNFFTEMRTIQCALPHSLRTDRFFGVPSLIETRWYCLRDFCDFILNRYHEIEEQLHPQPGQIPSAAYIALHTYHFDLLTPCLHDFCRFIEWTELEHATLAMAWQQILETFGSLNRLIVQGNKLALILRTSFEQRLSKTACLPQIILSHLITKEGLAWYRCLPSGDPKQTMQTKESLNDLTHSFRQYFQIILGCSAALLDATWHHYLEHAKYRDDESTISFWTRTRAKIITIERFSDHCSLGPLGEMSLILARLPCSEASVERVFSHMRQMLGDRAQAMHGDLLEARLTIKLNVGRKQTAEEFCSAVDRFIHENGDLQDVEQLRTTETVPIPVAQGQPQILGRWSGPRLAAEIRGQLPPRTEREPGKT
jgi:hypothetical protein